MKVRYWKTTGLNMPLSEAEAKENQIIQDGGKVLERMIVPSKSIYLDAWTFILIYEGKEGEEGEEGEEK